MDFRVYLSVDMEQWDPEPFEDAEWVVNIDEFEFEGIFDCGMIPTELNNFNRRKMSFVLSLEQEVFLNGVEASFSY